MKLLTLLLIPSLAFALPVVETMTPAEMTTTTREWTAKGDNYQAKVCGFTGSMWPYIRGFETVLMERRRWNTSLAVGDFVVFELADGSLGGHEIVDLRPGWVMTKGLANDRDDGWMAYGRIKFVVRRVVKL